ncbi:MAG TPA: BamA/TamA family outer membrane protein, partial [Polyangiales bacterium]
KGETFLHEHRYFEASLEAPILTIRGESAKVTFPAHVGPQYAFDVLGASPLLTRDVIDALLLERERLTGLTLDALPGRVQDLYARHGFRDARVSVARLMSHTVGNAWLRIRIAPGRQIEVVDVGFTGARHFPREFLHDQLVSYLEEDLPNADLIQVVDSDAVDRVTTGKQTPARQVPRPMAENPAGTYYEPTYKEAIKHITELYQADGFLAVKVGPAVIERVGQSRATVNIPIVEGPRTLLHDVVLLGQRLVSERELLLASGLTENSGFSYLRLEEARLRMQNLYNERGHMFVKIEPSVAFSHDRSRAAVTFQISERFPVHVGEIVVKGTQRTSVAFIRSLIALKPGDLYQPSLAHKSEETLQALGVFTGVSVAMQDPDLPARVKPLLVTVNERRNQFLDFSAGVSTGQGVRGGFEYGYRNLFDRAVSLTLRAQFAHQLFFVSPELRRRFEALSLEDRLERNISLGTVIPRVPGFGSTRTALDLVHVRHNERDFGLDKNGGTLTFSERPLHRVTVTEAADLENNDVGLFVHEALNDYLAMTSDPRLKRLLRVPEGNTTLAAFRAGISYDQRDSPFTPTKGFFTSASTELATTLSSQTVTADKTQFVSRFLKLQVTGSGYVPLSRSIVFAGQVRIGRIVHLIHDSKTYPDRAFFLGGVDSMRGYYQDEMVPQDIADKIITDPKLSPNAIVRSGDAFMLLKAELRFPLYGQLGAGLFTDFGNLWADPAMMNPFQLRPTAGAGLRLATPVGPIAVDYGIVINRRRGLGEPFGALAFSIGLF